MRFEVRYQTPYNACEWRSQWFTTKEEADRNGRLLPLLWFPLPHRPFLPCPTAAMMRSLTRSRSPEFHRATMIKLLIGGALLYTFWGPMQPIRSVTAEALYTAGDLIRR